MNGDQVPRRPSKTLQAFALSGIPRVMPGDDLPGVITDGLCHNGLSPRDGDVLCVTSKLLSRAEGRLVPLSTVTPSARAQTLGARTGKDPRLVELILRESTAVSRVAEGVLIVRHRLGFVSANGGIDASNVGPIADGPAVLLLPMAPDHTAELLRAHVAETCGAAVGVVITDSHGRPFRLGAVGVAIGCAGLPALLDQRGRSDMDGRPLEHTETALADQIASLSDLLCGQANEATPISLLRGLTVVGPSRPASSLYRQPERDLYA